MNFNEEFVKNRMELLENILNFGYLYFVFFVIFLWLFLKVKTKWKKIMSLLFSLSFLLLFYGQFIERFWIKTTYINLNKGWSTKVILISDQHLGVYKNSDYMEKVVEKINKIDNVDFVLIAGDLTYWPKDLEGEHSSLGKIKYPTYVALGNHDVIQSGGVSFKTELEKMLQENGITMLYNEKIKTKNGITIFGLGSLFAHEDDVSFLKNANPEKEKTILLFHNPDTTLKEYPDKDFSDTVTFAGHTHCGQVRIPFLYKYVTPIQGDFYDNGPYDLKEKGVMVVSCGLGESGIPIRLFNRPEIMVVDL